MCTVTFVNSGNQKIITSNRDEQVIRQAIEPKTYQISNKQLTFPKDPKAGGTWYAADAHGNVLVLLNGAAETHVRHLPYKKSRGIILLDILSSREPKQAWSDIDLDNIEPFTLVLYYENDLFQMRWDGNIKESITLDVNQNYIWSSSTLYSKEIRKNREKWFAEFIKNKPEATADEMFDFHRHTEPNNAQNGLVIDREGFLKTISITQTILCKNQLVMKHYDLVDQITSEMYTTL